MTARSLKSVGPPAPRAGVARGETRQVSRANLVSHRISFSAGETRETPRTVAIAWPPVLKWQGILTAARPGSFRSCTYAVRRIRVNA